MQTAATSVPGQVSRMMSTPPTIPIKMPKRLLISQKSAPIVYYPKPIPPPDVLPLTRTVRLLFIFCRLKHFAVRGLGLWCLMPLSTIFHLYLWLSVLLVEETGVAGENN